MLKYTKRVYTFAIFMIDIWVPSYKLTPPGSLAPFPHLTLIMFWLVASSD